MIPRPKYTNTSFFETRLAFRRFWVKETRHSENVFAEMCCYLYRKRRQRAVWYLMLTRKKVFYFFSGQGSVSEAMHARAHLPARTYRD